MRYAKKIFVIYIGASLLSAGAMACLYTKHDIHVTLDIRHIQETATDIEDVVSGDKELGSLEEESGALAPAPRPFGLARLFDFSTAAYAADADVKIGKLTPTLKKAIESRKKRFEAIRKYKAAGAVGEDNSALLAEHASALLKDAKEGPKIKALIKAENADRKAIYKEIAAQSKAKTAEDLVKVQKAWAKVHREKSKKGDWIQAPAKKVHYMDFLKEKWAKNLKKKPKPGSWFRRP